MRQWYISVKLTIWLARLYKSHRVVVDDSYNIRSGSGASEENTGSDIKKEVLFDVTDYKMKNQVIFMDMGIMCRHSGAHLRGREIVPWPQWRIPSH